MKTIRKSPWLAVLAAVLFASSVGFAATKILYFTSKSKPTTAEAAEIVKLNAITAAPFEVKIRNAQQVTRRETTTYIAGAIPPVYRDGGIDSGTPLYQIANPNDPPQFPTLPVNQATFTTGEYVIITSVAGRPSVRLTISNGAVTGATYVGPDAGS